MSVLAPLPGFQMDAALSPADHLLIGGIAGPGKSFQLSYNAIMDCSGRLIEYGDTGNGHGPVGGFFRGLYDKGLCDENGVIFCYKFPKYRAVLFRRERTHMDDLIDQCAEIYGSLGAKWSGNPNFHFTFPSGARVHLDHMQNLGDWVKHRGNARHFMGFDEVAEFYEQQVFGILPWNRSTIPALRPRLQGTCNFEGVGLDWVKKYWHIACECPQHNGKNRLFLEKIELGGGKSAKISKQFIFGKREGSYLEKNDPDYIPRLILQCGGVDTPRFRALGLGCCEVSRGAFFPELDKGIHLVPDNWLPKRFNWACVGGYDFAASLEGDAAAYVNILVNENRDIIVDDLNLVWGRSIVEQSEDFASLYGAGGIRFTGKDAFASNRAGGDIKTIADQFREEPKRAGKQPMIFVKCEPDNKTAASLIRSGLKAAHDGRNGAIYIRNRCKRVFDDLRALLADAKDFDVWVDQRITIEWNGVKRRYHFDAFSAFKHAICGAYHTERLPVAGPKYSDRREKNLKKIREKRENFEEPINCAYTLD